MVRPEFHTEERDLVQCPVHGVPRGRRDGSTDRMDVGCEQVQRLINGAFSARRVIGGCRQHQSDAARGPDGPPVGVALGGSLVGEARP
ncbi:MAG: hypothetical protein DWH79_10310 [Planctomycetota bacterium]|nr:MAG: hypothetical protein DWH79_10310 [Planctomycetota bacterium]